MNTVVNDEHTLVHNIERLKYIDFIFIRKLNLLYHIKQDNKR